MPIHADSTHQPELSNTSSLWHWLKGTWMDRMLLLIALIAIGISWQWLHQHLSGTPMVYIYHGKALLATYPLNPEKPIHFEAHGDIGLSEITIDKQGVRITHSSCATQRCVLSGHRHRIGGILACVPNRILVSIQGSQKQPLDAISE
ncbi:MAG: NusG domain II-containing protein [Mariprofundaceae bacterium]|nr:NusG domain II-containing protein [Mariprofundaceae bacterium]